MRAYAHTYPFSIRESMNIHQFGREWEREREKEREREREREREIERERKRGRGRERERERWVTKIYPFSLWRWLKGELAGWKDKWLVSSTIQKIESLGHRTYLYLYEHHTVYNICSAGHDLNLLQFCPLQFLLEFYVCIFYIICQTFLYVQKTMIGQSKQCLSFNHEAVLCEG